MEGLPLGLRDIILLLVVAAALYLAVMLLKLLRVGRRKPPQPDSVEVPYEPVVPAFSVDPEPYAGAAPMAAAARAVATYEELAEAEAQALRAQANPAWDDEVQDLFRDNRGPVQPAEPRPEARSAPSPEKRPATPGGSGFGEHLSEHLARTDMEMEVQRMRDEMQRMRQEMEELRTARRVSPQYAEAMELAQRGMTAQEVADHLGISLAEAELVKALSQGGTNYE